MRHAVTILGQIVAISVLCGCTLWGAGEFPSGEQIVLPERGERELTGQRVDIFRKNRGTPELPIENASAAIAAALGDEDLVAHLRTTDAQYGGRRLEGLIWIAEAASNAEDPAADWRVQLRARIRDSSAAYVCTVGVARDGRLTAQTPTRRNCTWEPIP